VVLTNCRSEKAREDVRTLLGSYGSLRLLLDTWPEAAKFMAGMDSVSPMPVALADSGGEP
jgi:hypothetical protein